MSTPVSLPSKTSRSAVTVGQESRIPAVIGTEPWSWQGDDNTGNMIHAAAARRLISKYVQFRKQGEWTEADIERLRSECSHLVYVTANIIRLGVPSGHPSINDLMSSQLILARNIERAALPVVVFGLGSQANLDGLAEFTTASETIRLLRVISDHSRMIAVRGAFTAEACARLGIKNVEVIGCQSMFWHRSPTFSWKICEQLTDASTKIAFNYTDAPSEANLINQAMARGHDVIGQQNDAEESLKAEIVCQSPYVKSSSDGSGMFPVTGNAGMRIAFQKGLIDRRQYEQWIRDHFFQFREPEAWLDHMRQYCFSYGTRLHGNMAAMIAGARALWIVHDMRLKEVCDHFRLPWVPFEEVRGGADLEALLDCADYSRCFQIYPDRYRVLFEYVDRSGLPHSLPDPVSGAATKPNAS